MTLLHEEITGSILDCAYKVHTELGPGLLESAYEASIMSLKKPDFLCTNKKRCRLYMKA